MITQVFWFGAKRLLVPHQWEKSDLIYLAIWFRIIFGKRTKLSAVQREQSKQAAGNAINNSAFRRSQNLQMCSRYIVQTKTSAF